MRRGGKNYKKTKQLPDFDAQRLGDLMRDAISTPPDHVKQPYDTNQPYQPTKFGQSPIKELTKKSG